MKAAKPSIALLVLALLVPALGAGCKRSAPPAAPAPGEAAKAPAAPAAPEAPAPEEVAKTPAKPAPADEAARAPAPKPEPPAAPAAPAADPALAAVPANADAVALVDGAAALSTWLPWLLALPEGGADAKALVEELATILQRSTGLDLRPAGEVVLFARADVAAAAVFLGVKGTPTWDQPVGEKGGVKLYHVDGGLVAAPLPQGLALGLRPAVEVLIDVAQGKAPSAATGSDAAELGRTLAGLGKAPLRLALAPERLHLPAATIGLGGLTWVGVGVGGDGLVGVGRGPKEAVAAAKGAIEARLAESEKSLEELRKQGANDPAIDLAALLAHHAAAPFRRQLHVEASDDALTVRLDGRELLVLTGVAYVSATAAVAVPAYIKYIRRAKTSEAIDGLDTLYKLAAVYTATPRVDSTGSRVPCGVPASTDWTPATSPCGLPGDRYPGGDAEWSGATWQALGFALTEPHRFRYKFEAGGPGEDALFTITASADLDCDGVWSTFQRIGYKDEGAATGECSLRGSSAFYTDNETE